MKDTSNIFTFVNFSGLNLGYRSMWRRLRKKYRMHVKQSTVLKYMRLIDPEGVESRRRRRLKRRKYYVPGSYHLLHIDGHDKLKPYGFAIHGAICGFSRKVVWLKVGTTNNKPEVIAHHYLEHALDVGYIPSIVRYDAGNENPLVGLIQRALRNDHADKFAGKNSYLCGPSTANQRIERYWGEARAAALDYYISFFKTLIHKKILNNKDTMDREYLRFCFGHLIQQDLERIQNEWNSHRLRAQKEKGLPSGIPNVLFSWPERYGAKDCKKKISKTDIQRIKNKFAIAPTLYNENTQRIVKLLVPNVTTPTNAEEAYNLFIKIKQRAFTFNNYRNQSQN